MSRKALADQVHAVFHRVAQTALIYARADMLVRELKYLADETRGSVPDNTRQQITLARDSMQTFLDEYELLNDLQPQNISEEKT